MSEFLKIYVSLGRLKALFSILLMIGLLIIFACKEDQGSKFPDTSAIDVDFELHRFDLDLRYLDTSRIVLELDSLYRSYPILTNLYFGKILNLEGWGSGKVQVLKDFVVEPRIRFLLDTVHHTYPHLPDVKEDFQRAFQNAKYHFPQKKTPNVYTIISEYGIGNFLFLDIYGDDALGVGLDFFLGTEYPYQQFVPNNTAFSNYLTRTFTKDYIVKKALAPWIEDWIGRAKGSRLLDKMVHEGIKVYVLQNLIPFADETILHEYTADELTFCRDNERMMWAYFLNNDLLYSVAPHQIRKYIEPSPHSSGMPEGAPGKTAVYIGFRIVSSYMDHNPDISLQELIQLTDYQLLLDQSRYRPNG